MLVSKTSMRVVILSDAETGGGAAICASRLAVGLIEQGCEVIRLVRVGNGQGPWKTQVLDSSTALGLWNRVGRKLGWIDATASRVTDSNQQLKESLAALKPDVINIHNLHWDQGAGWTPLMAEVCLDQAPTIWTLHDMWSFTGRCAYSWDCKKYLTGCDASCPTPQQYPAMEPAKIAGAWQLRQQMLARCPGLVAVTPSRWLAGVAQSGLWKQNRIEVIPYGLSLKTFQPIDQAAARRKLGIAPQGPVLLISANKISPVLFGALSSLRNGPVTVVMMGRGELPDLGPGVIRKDLGWLDQDADRVAAYNSADIFIHAASQDNLPNAIMESIACGTPVAATPAGGVGEMVRDGITGWMAKEFSLESLRAVIEQATTDFTKGESLRASCRKVAEIEYGDATQATKYCELFADISVRA